MRYIFVSDIHGNFKKLKDALEKVNFDAEKDTIVNLGDSFDRGHDSKQVLEFLLSCPHRILLWGNHDIRLYEIMTGQDYINEADYSNGILDTLISFTSEYNTRDFASDLIYILREDAKYGEIISKIKQYFNECRFAVEFKDLIATHAWLPTTCRSLNQDNLILDEDWRIKKDLYTWSEATWSNSQKLYDLKAFPDKPLLIGHWHAFRFAYAAGEKRSSTANVRDITLLTPVDCSSWTSPDGKLIAIDGCSNLIYGGRVNTYVYETNESPTIY